MRYLIWSVEHNAWWRPNWDGYTLQLGDAGRYEKTEAERIVREANLPRKDGEGFHQLHEVMIPEVTVLSIAECTALREAAHHWLERWPNEEFNPTLESALTKI